MKKRLFNNFIIIVILSIAVFILPVFYSTGIAIYSRLFLLILILIESLKLFKNIFVERKINKNISNTATVIFTLFEMFIILEIIFMFVPKSHNFDLTLASKLWFAKYWAPINSLGFRDHEYDNKFPVILFAGDSFTAGHGLKSVEDRFSNIVEKELNKKRKEITVINMGKIGLNSKDEYNMIKNFFYLTRIKPKAIILQYFANDIEYTDGIAFDYDIEKVIQTPLKPIIEGSYLVNYLYWLFPRNDINSKYIDFLDHLYKNHKIFSQHKNDLKLFLSYSNENSIQLVVVVFPFLTDLDMSNAMYVNDIVNYFKKNKVPVINVSELVKNISVTERIINNSDAHPSRKVNAIVANELIKILK